MDDIQLAQVAAAEDAVVQRLREKGLLLPDNPAGDAHCNDCLRQYGDEHGFPDLTIPDAIWERISPRKDEGGLLCPSCICKRLHAAGIRCEGKFASGPIVSSSERQQLESALATAFVSMQATYNPGERQGYWLECLRLAKEIERLEVGDAADKV